MAIVCVALSPGLLLDPSAVIERLIPLSLGSFDVPSSLDFGDLLPNEKRTADLTIRNLAWRKVQLQPIKVDCGCLMVHDTPAELAARSAATATVTIAAPAEPGSFSRTLLVRPQIADGPAWTVLVRGRVTATVWAEPSELNLTWGPETADEAEIKIRHMKGVRIGKLLPTSSEIEILDSRTRDSEVKLRVRITSKGQAVLTTGSASLDVYAVESAEKEKLALEIPIRWAPASKIGYVPQRLDLPGFGEEAGRQATIKRILAVVLPPEISAEDAQLQVLVPWMRISQKSVEGSVLRLELEFLGERMPSKFQQAILSTRLPGEEVPKTLLAVGDRG